MLGSASNWQGLQRLAALVWSCLEKQDMANGVSLGREDGALSAEAPGLTPMSMCKYSVCLASSLSRPCMASVVSLVPGASMRQ